MSRGLFRVAGIEDDRRDNVEFALGPLLPFIKDDTGTVQNICFNGGDPGPVFVQIAGRRQERVATMTRVERERALTFLATACEPSKAVGEMNSRLRCDLPFGWKGRVQGHAPPIDDWIGTIRMHAREVSTLDDYEARGELVIAPRVRVVERSTEKTPKEAIRAAIRRRDRIFIIGANGAGKTTTLNTVLGEMEQQFPHDRVAIIQDNREVQAKFANKIELQTLVEQVHFEINGVITRSEFGWLDALHDVLRCAIKRIIWGELREAASAYGLLCASYAGIIDGFATTLHCNSVEDIFARLEHLLHAYNVPPEMLGEFVQFIIFCEEYEDDSGETRRRISNLARSFGYENGKYIIAPAVAV